MFPPLQQSRVGGPDPCNGTSEIGCHINQLLNSSFLWQFVKPTWWTTKVLLTFFVSMSLVEKHQVVPNSIAISPIALSLSSFSPPMTEETFSFLSSSLSFLVPSSLIGHYSPLNFLYFSHLLLIRPPVWENTGSEMCSDCRWDGSCQPTPKSTSSLITCKSWPVKVAYIKIGSIHQMVLFFQYLFLSSLSPPTPIFYLTKNPQRTVTLPVLIRLKADTFIADG